MPRACLNGCGLVLAVECQSLDTVELQDVLDSRAQTEHDDVQELASTRKMTWGRQQQEGQVVDDNEEEDVSGPGTRSRTGRYGQRGVECASAGSEE